MEKEEFDLILASLRENRERGLKFIENISGKPGSLLEIARMKRLIKKIDDILEDFS